MSDRSPAWVTAWGGSLGGSLGAILPQRSTLRQFMRLSAGGSAVRLRLTNLAAETLSLSGVAVAVADESGGSRGPSVRPTWAGRYRADVPAGGSIVCDPFELEVMPLDRLRVSMTSEGVASMSTHDFANTISYLADGDHLDDGSGPFRPWRTSWAWVDAIDVLGADVSGAVVALGDSITDGAGSDFGSDTRWTDHLARRLLALPAGDGRRRAVVNAGIGGNTVCSMGNALVGANALDRLERDVLALSGVRELIVLHGTNDAFVETEPETIIDGLAVIARRARSAGIRPILATLAPRIGGLDWTDAREQRRLAVNRWIRRQADYDHVIDVERVLISPEGGIRPEYDADHTHPGSRGYAAMADSIDLELFARPPLRKDPPPWPSD